MTGQYANAKSKDKKEKRSQGGKRRQRDMRKA